MRDDRRILRRDRRVLRDGNGTGECLRGDRDCDHRTRAGNETLGHDSIPVNVSFGHRKRRATGVDLYTESM